TDNSFWNFSEWALYNNYWGTVITNVAPSTSPTCTTPYNLAASHIMATSATLKWTGSSNLVNYNIRYRITGTPAWSFATSTNATYNVTGLTPGMGYEWQVETVCKAGDTYYSASSF